MANELATTPPGAPPQAAEPTPRSWLTDPWQAQPPLAPVDPPPCSTDTAPPPPEPLIAAATARMPEEAPSLVMTSERWGAMMDRGIMPGQPTPRIAMPLGQTVVEPVHLGKETPAAEMAKLLEKVPHGNPPDTAQR